MKTVSANFSELLFIQPQMPLGLSFMRLDQIQEMFDEQLTVGQLFCQYQNGNLNA